MVRAEPIRRDPLELPDRACDGKKTFFRLARAHQSIRELEETGEAEIKPGKLVAYACNKCRGWHIGHEPRWRLFDDERDVVEASLGLVGDELRRMRIPMRRRWDCYQSGVIGLAAAVRRCRADKGSLAAYAREAIRNRVRDAVECDRLVKIPRDQIALMRGKVLPKAGGGRRRTATLFRSQVATASAPLSSLDDPGADRGKPIKLFHGGPPPEYVATTRDEVDHVLSLIQAKDPKAAGLIKLDLAGYDRQEIAEMTGMSRTVVNATIARGYKVARGETRR